MMPVVRRIFRVIGANGEPCIEADLADVTILTAEAARETVEGLVRFDPKKPEEWLDRIVGHVGVEAHTVPEGVMRAYDALVAAQEEGRALCPKDSAS